MNTAHSIGVVGGSGGVGASVLTAAIAVRAAQMGLRPVCLDGDRLGGGLDVTLGIEQERGVRWPDLAGARGRIDGPELLRRLPSVDGVSVLSFDRARDVRLNIETVQEVFHAVSLAADLVGAIVNDEAVLADDPQNKMPAFMWVQSGMDL